MRSTLALGLLILALSISPAPAQADGVAAGGDVQLPATSAPLEAAAGPSATLTYCEATCMGAPPVSCQASSCSAQEATCSSPGWIQCDGVYTYCSAHDPQPSVSLSCVDLFRRIECTASVSGGTGSYSYSWNYQGSASTWTSSGNDAWASFPPTGCTGANHFSVTVSDTCGSDYDSENLYCDHW